MFNTASLSYFIEIISHLFQYSNCFEFSLRQNKGRYKGSIGYSIKGDLNSSNWLQIRTHENDRICIRIWFRIQVGNFQSRCIGVPQQETWGFSRFGLAYLSVPPLRHPTKAVNWGCVCYKQKLVFITYILHCGDSHISPTIKCSLARALSTHKHSWRKGWQQ